MSESDQSATEIITSNSWTKFIRIGAIVLVVAALLFLVMSSLMSKPDPSEQAWNLATTVGSNEPEHHYIMYTDLMCPYCDVFSRVVQENWEEFQQYLDEHKILFEVRLTDYLYEASSSEYSRAAAEATYCAAREDKFWEYYHAAISALWNDYQSKGIGSNKNAEPIRNLPKDYWTKIGHKVGLGARFDQCVANHESVAEIEDNTRRALQSAAGMPYFKFDRFATSGFDDTWGWEYVKMYLEAGLGKK